ncbi:MAG TPA: nucleotidyltransferase family protein [Xanthobacteraceae bacterium]|nr:nucleotidyltransferase family protein [Xanthobacteraceae bacterium]
MTKLGDVIVQPHQSPNDTFCITSGGQPFTPVFELIAACCQWPPSQSRNAAIRAAAGRVTDWDDFLSALKRQRVAGLVHSALLLAEAPYPTAIASTLARRARSITQRSLILMAETLRLQALFEAAYIPVLALKGVALAQLAYGSVLAKEGRDIDLLVPPEYAEASLQLLEDEGYALSSPTRFLNGAQRRNLITYGKEIELRRKGPDLLVELQWRTANNPQLLQGIDARSSTQTVKLPDGSVRTLAPDDLFAYLSVHGAQHSWSRLKWLADVNALAAAEGTDLEHLYRHAERAGAGICAGQTLLLCKRILALPLPSTLADKLLQDKRVRRLVNIGEAAITSPHAHTAADNRIGDVLRFLRTQFLLGRGWGFYAEQCRIAAVGPIDVVRIPLPRPLHFLYPIIRLPLWLFRRMGVMPRG